MHKKESAVLLGTILILDHKSYPDSDLRNAVLVVGDHIPVLDDTGDLIGSAEVYRTGNSVHARCTINYNSSIRLDVETGTRKWYAYGVGKISGTEGKNGKLNVSCVEVASVQLIPEPPFDGRIEPVWMSD